MYWTEEKNLVWVLITRFLCRCLSGQKFMSEEIDVGGHWLFFLPCLVLPHLLSPIPGSCLLEIPSDSLTDSNSQQHAWQAILQQYS